MLHIHSRFLPAYTIVMISQSERDTAIYRRNRLVLITIVGCIGLSLAYLVSKAPPSPQPQCAGVDAAYMAKIGLPSALGGFDKKLEKLRQTWVCAEAYQQKNYTYTLIAFASFYVTLQAIAMPGSLILSILSGALFPFVQAQVIVLLCATVGASTCYLLSYMLGRVVIKRLMPDKMASFNDMLEAHKDNLLFFMIFLRITPLVPNAFVNLASSVVGMPFPIFFSGTLIGLIPATFIHVSTGRSLRDAAVEPDAGKGPIITLFLLQFVALLPVFMKKRIAAVAERKGKSKDS